MTRAAEVLAEYADLLDRAMLESAARAAGHGAIVDDWEPHVAWLRGDE